MFPVTKLYPGGFFGMCVLFIFIFGKCDNLAKLQKCRCKLEKYSVWQRFRIAFIGNL